MTNQKYTSATS